MDRRTRMYPAPHQSTRAASVDPAAAKQMEKRDSDNPRRSDVRIEYRACRDRFHRSATEWPAEPARRSRFLLDTTASERRHRFGFVGRVENARTIGDGGRATVARLASVGWAVSTSSTCILESCEAICCADQPLSFNCFRQSPHKQGVHPVHACARSSFGTGRPHSVRPCPTTGRQLNTLV